MNDKFTNKYMVKFKEKVMLSDEAKWLMVIGLFSLLLGMFAAAVI